MRRTTSNFVVDDGDDDDDANVVSFVPVVHTILMIAAFDQVFRVVFFMNTHLSTKPTHISGKI